MPKEVNVEDDSRYNRYNATSKTVNPSSLKNYTTQSSQSDKSTLYDDLSSTYEMLNSTPQSRQSDLPSSSRQRSETLNRARDFLKSLSSNQKEESIKNLNLGNLEFKEYSDDESMDFEQPTSPKIASDLSPSRPRHFTSDMDTPKSSYSSHIPSSELRRRLETSRANFETTIQAVKSSSPSATSLDLKQRLEVNRPAPPVLTIDDQISACEHEIASLQSQLQEKALLLSELRVKKKSQSSIRTYFYRFLLAFVFVVFLIYVDTVLKLTLIDQIYNLKSCNFVETLNNFYSQLITDYVKPILSRHNVVNFPFY